MDVDSGDTVPADFHKEKIGRPSGVLRGIPPKRLFASFLHEEKGRGRAFDLLFSKIAIFLRGHTDKPFFQVWPEGHLLSSHEERRQRRAKGESLGTPGSLPAFFLGKPTGGRTTKSRILNKVLRPEDLAAINPWFFGNNKRPPKNGGRLRACYVTISAPARTNICWAALRRTSATNSSGYRLRASDSSRSFRPSSEGSRGFKSSYIFSSRWIIC